MKRILVITGGMAPAIVTETIWALARQREPAFVPDRIVVVVTADAKPLYEKMLLGADGKLAMLGQALRLPEPGLEGITSIAATASRDIRSHDDAVAFGDLVCEVVQDATSDPDALVHLSLAGGRKTMSFHGGAALSLFGRPQDELSHVLVHPPELERAQADFWWPGHNQDGAVELALIPFLRVRERVDKRLLGQRMDYARYVAQVNAAIEGRGGLVLELIAETSTLRIAGGAVSVRLEPADFRVYRVIAEWARASVPGAGPGGMGGNHAGWLSTHMIREPHRFEPNPIARLIALGASRLTYRADTTERSPSEDGREPNAAFGQAVSRVRKAIRAQVLDEALARRLLGENPGTRGGGEPARFGIELSPHEIAIREREGGPEVDGVGRSG